MSFVNIAIAQKKVKKRPNTLYSSSSLNYWVSDADSDLAWLVFVDNDDVVSYNNPRQNEYDKKYNLEFKDHFYVTDSKEDMIRICKTKIGPNFKIVKNSYKDYGWVHINDMLLCNQSLKDYRSGISKKAFLLNKLSDVKEILKLEKREIVKLYTHPIEGEVIGNKTIYEFYFVYKYEGNRVLLGKSFSLNSRSGSDNIVGWVRRSRISEWNTRVCLEPNFSDDAFLERSEDENLRVVAYSNETAVKNHVSYGVKSPIPEDIVWANDPVLIDEAKLANLNPNRFKGPVMRFPLLKDNTTYFTSGLIGEIQVKTFGEQLSEIEEIHYSNIQQEFNKQREASKSYNIFFLIEASPSMKPYKEKIISIIENINSKIPNAQSSRVGIGLYRDVRDGDDILQIKELESDKSEISNFIREASFERTNANDTYRSMYYGIVESIQDAGFDKLNNNILCVIGNNADYTASAERRLKAKAESHPTYFVLNDVAQAMAEVNLSLIGIQLNNEGNRSNRKFVDQLSVLMEQNSTIQNNIFKNVQEYFGVNVINPSLPNIDDEIKIKLIGGPKYSAIFRPNSGSSFNAENIDNYLSEAFVELDNYTMKFWDQVSKVIDDGSSFEDISAGGAQNGFGLILEKLMREGNRWSKDDIKFLVKNKYKLYTEVFLPKKYESASNDCFSYVLFMPDKELESYIKKLRYLEDCSDSDPTEQRECLFESFTTLARQLTGESIVDDRMSTEELRAKLEGLTAETSKSIWPSKFRNFMFKDIKNRRKVSDEEVIALVDEIIKNKERLEKIFDLKHNYEFSFTEQDNLYYWIPIEFTL